MVKFTYNSTGKRIVTRTKKKSNLWPLATKKYVQKAISKTTETKYFQDSASISGTAVSTTAGLWDITAIPQGSTDTTRVGDKLKMKRIIIKANIQSANVATLGTTDDVRIIMFQWYPNSNLIAPVLASILNNTTASTICQSFYNHDYINQYHILYDKRFRLLGGTSIAQRDIIIKPRKMRFVKKNIEFSNASTAGSNKIYVLLVADKVAGTNATITAISKVWFTDA